MIFLEKKMIGVNVALLKTVSISEKLQLTEGFFGPREKEIASEKLKDRICFQ